MTAVTGFMHSRSERSLGVEDYVEENWGRESKLCIQLLEEGNQSLRDQGALTHTTRPTTVPISPKVLDFRKSSKTQTLTEIPFASPTSTASRSPPQPSNALNMPRYSHGKDPTPHVKGTFMYQPVYVSKPPLVDQNRKSYEIKYERYRKKLRQSNSKESPSSTPVLLDSENIRLLKLWYAEMDRRKTGLVPKPAIIKFLHDNPQSAELFGLEEVLSGSNYMSKTEEILGNIGLNTEGMTLEEFLAFYQISRNNKDPSVPSSELSQSGVQSEPLLPPHVSTLIATIYREMRAGETVNRKEFLSRLQLEVEVQACMDRPAVRMDEQVMTLSHVLASISREEAELLTWEEVTAWLGFNSLYLQEDFVLLKESDIEALKQVFDYVSLEIDLAPRYQFINEVRGQLPHLLEKTAREPRGLSRIPTETLSEVLQRIEASEGELLTWQQFLAFVSTVGEPETGYDSEPEVNVQTERTTYDRPPRSLSSDELRSRLPLGSRYSITIPHPFTFTTRERSKRKPIRQIKLEEMLADKEEREMAPCKVRIKARAVPAEVVIPAFERIMKEQEERRQAVHMASVELTKSRERPFSFYYRDMMKGKPQRYDPEPYVFKANPIPWECTVPLYERMVTEGEELRRERMEMRAQTLLSQAKLHPRMQLYYGSSIQVKKPEPQEMKVEMVKANPVPDFTALQTQFQRTLDAKKRSFKSTIPQPFHFNESRKTSDYREYLDVEKAGKQWTAPETANLGRVFQKPVREPASTAKHKGLIELRKQEQAKREAAKEAKRQADLAREERRERVRPLVQGCEVITDNTKALTERRQQSIKEAKRAAQEQHREFQLEMEKMMERVYARPLLVEQVAEDARRRAGKMRAMMEQQRLDDSEQDLPFSEESSDHR